MCRVLLTCRSKLKDLAPNFHVSNQNNIFGVVEESCVESDIANYVDDNMFAFVAKTVKELVEKAIAVATIVHIRIISTTYRRRTSQNSISLKQHQEIA